MNNIKNKGIAFFNWSKGMFEEGLNIVRENTDPNTVFKIACLGLSVTAVTLGALSYRNNSELIESTKKVIILNENKINGLNDQISNLTKEIATKNDIIEANEKRLNTWLSDLSWQFVNYEEKLNKVINSTWTTGNKMDNLSREMSIFKHVIEDNLKEGIKKLHNYNKSLLEMLDQINATIANYDKK